MLKQIYQSGNCNQAAGSTILERCWLIISMDAKYHLVYILLPLSETTYNVMYSDSNYQNCSEFIITFLSSCFPFYRKKNNLFLRLEGASCPVLIVFGVLLSSLSAVLCCRVVWRSVLRRPPLFILFSYSMCF
jgi:hypothetical protein